jgi:small subunit ribosomal protein S2
MVDTNSDPREVDYVIPSNDDASKSIDKILTLVTDAVKDGLANRTSEKDGEESPEAEVVAAPEVAAVVEEVAVVATEEVAVAEAPVAEVEVATEAEATEETKTEE